MFGFRSMSPLAGLVLVIMLGGCLAYPARPSAYDGCPGYYNGHAYGVVYNGYGGGWYR